MKILCVAEKPSIAKAVAGHLSGGPYQVVSKNLKVKMSPAELSSAIFQVTSISRITASTSISVDDGVLAML